MSSALKVLAGLFSIPALIITYIISYHLITTVIPDYLGLWIVGLILSLVGFAFNVAASATED